MWVSGDAAGLTTWVSALIAFAVGCTVRILALYRAWEELLAAEPTGVYIHAEGRPMLGCNLAGKSQRELRELGLAVDEAPRR